MVPSSALLLKSRYPSCVIKPTSVAMVPSSALLLKPSKVSCVIKPTSVGMVPSSALLLKSLLRAKARPHGQSAGRIKEG